MKNTVLVTGVAGYIGSVVARHLLDQGYIVRGVDSLKFGGEALLGISSNSSFSFHRVDIRDALAMSKMVEGVSGVAHLAAIVGDPACAREPELAEETNWIALKQLFDRCSGEAGLRSFVFASTCSNYGRMDGDTTMTEESPLNPVSLYARQKVRAEEYILSQVPQNEMAVTALRFSTAYGLSPRMRFDLTVNEFMRDVAAGRELVVYGEQFWRPYCHVNDLARACVSVLQSEPAVVGGVFGVGDSTENYQKKMIVEAIQGLVPDARVRYVEKTEDPRDYRVDFSKIRKALGFEITKRVPDGLREVQRVIGEGMLQDPFDVRYRNIA